MSGARSRQPGRSLPALTLLLSLLLGTSCSSAPPSRPPGPAQGTSTGAAPAVTPPPAAQGTALKTAAPGVLAKAKAERDALEAVIAFGSPSSLMRACGVWV